MQSHRRPTWVYDAGEEPDYRFTLANERTFLAWVRTSLGLMGGGVAIDAFNVATPTMRAILASALVALGGLCAAAAALRWARVEKALRERRPLPAASLTWLTSATLLAVAVAILLVI